MPIGMLVVLDSILNRITQNRAKGKNTFIFIDDLSSLFQHEILCNPLPCGKRVRKYGAYASGITQECRWPFAEPHSENNACKLRVHHYAESGFHRQAWACKTSEYFWPPDVQSITNVEAGHGLIKVGSSLYRLQTNSLRTRNFINWWTTKPGEA